MAKLLVSFFVRYLAARVCFFYYTFNVTTKRGILNLNNDNKNDSILSQCFVVTLNVQ